MTVKLVPRGPRVIIAGIRTFGLASDGSDLRDLEAALSVAEAERDAIRARTVADCARAAEHVPEIADKHNNVFWSGYCEGREAAGRAVRSLSPSAGDADTPDGKGEA